MHTGLRRSGIVRLGPEHIGGEMFATRSQNGIDRLLADQLGIAEGDRHEPVGPNGASKNEVPATFGAHPALQNGGIDDTASTRNKRKWWAHQDSNLEPDGYEPSALTIELWAPTGRDGYSNSRRHAIASRDGP